MILYYGDTTTYAYKEDIIKICKCNPLRLLNNDSIFYKGKITYSTDKSYFTIKVKNLKYNLLIDKNTKKVLVNNYIYRYVDTVGYKIMKNISFDNFIWFLRQYLRTESQQILVGNDKLDVSLIAKGYYVLEIKTNQKIIRKPVSVY